MRVKILSFIIFLFSAGSLYAGGFSVKGVSALSFDDGKLMMAGGLNADWQPDGIPFIFESEVLFYDNLFEDDFRDAGIKSVSGGLEFIAGEINLFSALNFFYGPELMAGYDFSSDRIIISNAIFAGFNGFFIPHIQFFLQAGWRPQVLISRGNVDFQFINFPARAGLRLWTK